MTTYKELVRHKGHDLEAVTYGGGTNNIAAVIAAIECRDCDEIVVEKLNPELQEE